MKLRGYDMLMDIRRAGAKPTFISLYLFPVKRLPCTHEFIDISFSTVNETSELDEYELDAIRGLDVCLIGKRKDGRLRNACKTLKSIAKSMYVTSGDHDGVDVWQNGVWS